MSKHQKGMAIFVGACVFMAAVVGFGVWVYASATLDPATGKYLDVFGRETQEQEWMGVRNPKMPWLVFDAAIGLGAYLAFSKLCKWSLEVRKAS